MNPFIEQAKQFLTRLTRKQQAMLGGVVLGGFVVFGGLAYWAGQPDYTLLFGRLAPTDASRIVETLTERGVPYEIRENGAAVYVPRAQVYELRLQFAGDGLVADGPAGYELFDEGTLGMTDFMQKLNVKRALEGELSRTISNIRQVEVARVHLVLPERSPFRQAQAEPSASVVLELTGGSLSREQIEGIGALVAGAVEGLDPSAVTVLDTRGALLSNPDAGNADLLTSSTQLRMQQAVEQRLVEKGQSMLDQVLGPGNAIIRVTATLDFERAVAERDLIDPESATVISEEKLEEGAEGYESATSAIRNYELSRTRERSEKSIGDVADLSVSVILNHKRLPLAEDAEVPEYTPYVEEELQEIEALVKNAVGFKADRGDRFALHQTRFDTTGDEQLVDELREQRRQDRFQLYLRYGFMLLVLAGAALLLRTALRRVATLPTDPLVLDQPLETRRLEGEQAAGKTIGESVGPRQLAAAEVDEPVLIDDVYTSKLSPEARARLKARHLMFEEIQAEVQEHPEEAADLLRNWMLEDAEPATI